MRSFIYNGEGISEGTEETNGKKGARGGLHHGSGKMKNRKSWDLAVIKDDGS